jgi:hypothetical protein
VGLTGAHNTERGGEKIRMATVSKVARWMVSQLRENTFLYQQEVAYQITDKFGEGFTYYNKNGNLAINSDVLAEFRCLTSNEVVWERGQRCWRMREKHDEPGRQQR